MADYLIAWVDYALDQDLALDPQLSSSLSDRLRALAQQPTSDAHSDRVGDHRSAEFDTGRGLVIEVVNEHHRRGVILRPALQLRRPGRRVCRFSLNHGDA